VRDRHRRLPWHRHSRVTFLWQLLETTSQVSLIW
jgi:hypothetical protein